MQEVERVERVRHVAVSFGCASIPPVFGICCWMTFGFFPEDVEWDAVRTVFTHASALAQIAALVVWGAFSLRLSANVERWLPLTSALLLEGSAALLMAAIALDNKTMIPPIGILLGTGVSGLMLSWESVIAGMRESSFRRIVPLGMALSPVFFLMLFFLSPHGVVGLLFLGILPFNFWGLWVCRDRGRGAKSARAMGSEKVAATDGVRSGEARAAGDGVRFWGAASVLDALPPRFPATVACAFVIVMVTAVADSASLRGAAPSASKLWLVNGGLLVSSVILFWQLCIKKRSFDLVKVYLVSTPVLAVLLFLAPFVGSWYGYCLMFVGLVGFFAVQTGLMVQCALWAQQRCIPVGFLYGIAAGAAYGSRYGTEVVFGIVQASAVSGEIQVLAIAAFALYALSLVGLYAARKGGGTLRSRNDADHPEAAFALFCNTMGFSRREAEVAQFLCEGLDVPAIAERLVLSKDTVRTHIKNLYRKCGVHSREEFQSFARARMKE